MATFFWYLGKILQLGALVQVGYALMVGLNSNDPTEELRQLLIGVAIFIVGWFCVRMAGSGAEGGGGAGGGGEGT